MEKMQYSNSFPIWIITSLLFIENSAQSMKIKWSNKSFCEFGLKPYSCYAYNTTNLRVATLQKSWQIYFMIEKKIPLK